MVGNQTAMDNLEVLYENDEVAHSASSNLGDGVVMALYAKEHGKFERYSE